MYEPGAPIKRANEVVFGILAVYFLLYWYWYIAFIGIIPASSVNSGSGAALQTIIF